VRYALLIALLYCGSAQAVRYYVDIGGGWLDELPAESEVEHNGQDIFSQKGTVNIDSPYLDLSIGVEFDSFYIEYRRFGTDLTDEKESISLFKIGKRIYF
jgi:hypothetical protein